MVDQLLPNGKMLRTLPDGRKYEDAPRSGEVQDMLRSKSGLPLLQRVSRSQPLLPLYELGKPGYSYVVGRTTEYEELPNPDKFRIDPYGPQDQNWYDISTINPPTTVTEVKPYELGQPSEPVDLDAVVAARKATTPASMMEALKIADKIADGIYQRTKDKWQQAPNKLSNTDGKWTSKVAWSSGQLFERQAILETYSVETAMVIENVRSIASTALSRTVKDNELEFYANFGSPIVSNRLQRISITVAKPVSLTIILIRELDDGKLRWSAEVSTTLETPLASAAVVNKMNQRGVELATNPVVSQPVEEQPYEKTKRRRITL